MSYPNVVFGKPALANKNISSTKVIVKKFLDEDAAESALNEGDLYVLNNAQTQLRKALGVEYTSLTSFPDIYDITSMIVSPDSKWVVLLGKGSSFLGQTQLYSIRADGTGSAIPLIPSLPGFSYSITNYDISPNSLWVVYRGDLSVDNDNEVYSVPIDGSSAPVKLNGTLAANGDVSAYLISPNSLYVAYNADQTTDNVIELYINTINGGTSTKISKNPVAGGNVGFYLFSNDSNTVFYTGDMDTDSNAQIYSVSVSGGSSTALTTPTNTTTNIFSMMLSPNGNKIVYLADEDSEGVNELYSMDIDGSNHVKLNDVLISNGDVFTGFMITPDSSRVVYSADQEVDNVIELYGVPIGGGTVVKYSLGLTTPKLGMSTDGSYVYFTQTTSSGFVELRTVPIAGGLSTLISDKVVVSDSILINDIYISPDSQKIVIFAGISGSAEKAYSLSPTADRDPILLSGSGSLTIINTSTFTSDSKYFVYRDVNYYYKTNVLNDNDPVVVGLGGPAFATTAYLTSTNELFYRYDSDTVRKVLIK